MIALIPARSGSKRIPNKNIRLLGDHPLLAYSIVSALESSLFSRVCCSSDSQDILAIAEYYGAYPILRPADYATDLSPDADWIRNALSQLYLHTEDSFDSFAILRPTSPFREAATIARAYDQFLATRPRKNLKAVEPASQSPYKMWRVRDGRATPFIGAYDHLLPLQSLPLLYVQNGCVEMRWYDGEEERFSTIQPFRTINYEGLDINTECDWIYAEHLIAMNAAQLPTINKSPYGE